MNQEDTVSEGGFGISDQVKQSNQDMDLVNNFMTKRGTSKPKKLIPGVVKEIAS